jgi:hypothetical protein
MRDGASSDLTQAIHANRCLAELMRQADNFGFHDRLIAHSSETAVERTFALPNWRAVYALACRELCGPRSDESLTRRDQILAVVARRIIRTLNTRS